MMQQMPFSSVLLILVSVLLSSTSQVLLKIGMTTAAVQAALAQTGKPFLVPITIATSPLVVIGLASFGLSAVVWLFVLSRVPLSLAYPFVALGFVVTVVAGHFVLGEQVATLKLLGVALIVTGVIAIGLSG